MKKTILLLGLLLLSTITFGQKMKILEGNIKNLKGITQFDLVFDYSDVQIPEYDSEQAYLKEEMTKRDLKSFGSGEIFEKKWFEDRKEKYQPKFINGFNNRFKNSEVSVAENSDAVTVVLIQTIKLFPGTNIGVSKNTSTIDVEITIYSKDNPDKILLKGVYTDVFGHGKMGYAYDNGYRLSECYEEVGIAFGNYIRKKAK